MAKAAQNTPRSTDNAASADTENQVQGAAEGTEEKTDEKKLEAFSFEMITEANSKELAEAIWARIPGDTYQARHDALQTLFEQIREARNANKTTRVKKTIEDILGEIKGKSMGDLQAVKVPLGAISVAVPQIVKLASSEANGPMEKMAKDWLAEHKLSIVKRKVSSKGKESTFLEAA